MVNESVYSKDEDANNCENLDAARLPTDSASRSSASTSKPRDRLIEGMDHDGFHEQFKEETPEYVNTREWKIGRVFDYTELDDAEDEEELYLLDSNSSEIEDGILRFGWTIEDFEAARCDFKHRRIRSRSYRYASTYWWRLIVYPDGKHSSDMSKPYLSVFAEVANPEEQLNSSWTQRCKVDIVLLNGIKGNNHHHRSRMVTFSNETKLAGFENFISLDLLRKETGFLDMEGRLHLEMRIRKCADYNNMADYDSKRRTGMVGLRNLGATCYLNSLLQTLYHTRKLRQAVYDLDTSKDDTKKGVALGLQRLFWSLQTSDVAAETRRLTEAFGWDNYQCFMQHDVTELNRELCDKLEERMRNTPQAGTIKNLFTGTYRSFIRCINVNYESSRDEEFYDIQLDIKGMSDVYASFDKYVEVEKLEGDNQYEAEGYGKQDAHKGVRFLTFPPVLHLHLKRFGYDIETDSTIKLNDRFEFPVRLNLNKYLHEDAEERGYNYLLHSVLVHSGDVNAGHYYAYINTMEDLKNTWYKFDDEMVVRVKEAGAVNATFGGEYISKNGLRLGSKRISNAYMLVYIQENKLSEVQIAETDIVVRPQLIKRFKEEKHKEELERDREIERRMFVRLRLVKHSDLIEFSGYQPRIKGSYFVDFVDFSRIDNAIKIERQATPKQVYKAVANHFGLNKKRMRLWVCVGRDNRTERVGYVLQRRNMSETLSKIFSEISIDNPGNLFCEELDLDQTYKHSTLQIAKKPRLEETPSFENAGETGDETDEADELFGEDDDTDILARQHRKLVFIRYFDRDEREKGKMLKHLGHMLVKGKDTFGFVMETAIKKFLPELDLSECVIGDLVTPLRIEYKNLSHRVCDSQILTGDILFVEKLAKAETTLSLRQWLDSTLYDVKVNFYPINNPKERTCQLELNAMMKYPDVACELNKALEANDPILSDKYDGMCLRLVGDPHNEDSVDIRRNLKKIASPSLEEIHARTFTVFWEKLPCKVHELNDVTLVKVDVVFGFQKNRGIVIAMKNCETIASVVSSIRKETSDIPQNCQIRIFQTYHGQFDRIFSKDDIIHGYQFNSCGMRHHDSKNHGLIAEVDLEGKTEEEEEGVLCFVVHAYRRIEKVQTFDFPFTIRIKSADTVHTLKERVKFRSEIADEDFNKLKFVGFKAGGLGKYVVFEDDAIVVLDERSVFPKAAPGRNIQQIPTIGLLHDIQHLSKENPQPLLRHDKNRHDQRYRQASQGLSIRSS